MLLKGDYRLVSLFSLEVIIFSFALYLLCWVLYTRWWHPLHKIPGPFLASISRYWAMAQVNTGTTDKTQRALHEQYGSLVRIAPNEIACASPDALKIIYPMSAPLEKTDFYSVWGPVTPLSKHPDNFTCQNEKVHAERRRIVSHVYSLSNVLKSEQYIDECSDLFVDRLAEFAEANQPIDLGLWLQMYAFDVVGQLYFGDMFGFMRNRHDHEDFIASLDILVPSICSIAVAPSYIRPLILATAFLSPSVRKALKAIEKITQAAKACVIRRCDAIVSGQQPRQDLLQQLLQIRDDKGEKVDFDIPEIQLEAYVAIFAGSDTTAIALRSVIYHLLKNQEIYFELVQELDDAAAAGQLSNPVKHAEAIKLPLMCACIKEAMRLHPSVGFTMPRIVPAGGITIDGQRIPAGYRVGINPAVLHYNKDIFGQDADRYNPKRWLGSGATLGMDKYMIQFGAGTRTCIGKNISLSELHKLIPQLLRSFEIRLVDDSKEWRTYNTWFHTQKGLNVLVTKRYTTMV